MRSVPEGAAIPSTLSVVRFVKSRCHRHDPPAIESYASDRAARANYRAFASIMSGHIARPPQRPQETPVKSAFKPSRPKHFARPGPPYLIGPHDPPVNILGGYKFPDAPTIDLGATGEAPSPPANSAALIVTILADLTIPVFYEQHKGENDMPQIKGFKGRGSLGIGQARARRNQHESPCRQPRSRIA
jgi:hypothetical protein